jgi:hypothetical protein
MVNITLSVSEELKKEMEQFPEINWSVIFREAIKRRMILLKQIREFAKDSEITEEDAMRLGREINKEAAKRYKKGK